ncbi:hypothetical protein E4U36_000772 [Claviceps purpurea]|nr:hypothetical protein E4U36_000772 [Claviceps purpurea]
MALPRDSNMREGEARISRVPGQTSHSPIGSSFNCGARKLMRMIPIRVFSKQAKKLIASRSYSRKVQLVEVVTFQLAAQCFTPLWLLDVMSLMTSMFDVSTAILWAPPITRNVIRSQHTVMDMDHLQLLFDEHQAASPTDVCGSWDTFNARKRECGM